MLLRSLLLATTFAIVSAAEAADRDGNYAVWGVGQRSCNQFNTARERGELTEYESYALGYLTAYNTFVPDTFRIAPALDRTGVIAWLDRYCSVTPVDSFERALKQMMEHFHAERQTLAPNARRLGW